MGDASFAQLQAIHTAPILYRHRRPGFWLVRRLSRSILVGIPQSRAHGLDTLKFHKLSRAPSHSLVGDCPMASTVLTNSAIPPTAVFTPSAAQSSHPQHRAPVPSSFTAPIQPLATVSSSSLNAVNDTTKMSQSQPSSQQSFAMSQSAPSSQTYRQFSDSQSRMANGQQGHAHDEGPQIYSVSSVLPRQRTSHASPFPFP